MKQHVDGRNDHREAERPHIDKGCLKVGKQHIDNKCKRSQPLTKMRSKSGSRIGCEQNIVGVIA